MDLTGQRLGKYLLGERIGEGGNGAVYAARQPALDRDVVIKVMHGEVRPDTVERFHREAQIAARLDHPYAAHIYDFGARADGQLWIAMERVRGRTLEQLLDSQVGRALSIDTFAPLLDRLARVVHAAHAAGIVHRDVKPSNVMVTERAGELLPKLLDFGFAAVRAELVPVIDPDAPVPPRLTPRSSTFGSPSYMAPEQWRGPEVGPSADLYALGVLTFEALAGTLPFRGETLRAIAMEHCTAPVPRLVPGLDRFFERALAKRPEQRFANALELAAALRTEAEAHLLARLRDAAARWHRAGRPRGMLWRDDSYQELARWLDRSARADAMEPLDLAFVDASRELADLEAAAQRRRAAWARRGGVLTGLAIAGVVIGILHYQAKVEARAAVKLAAATAIEADVEQGRAALLHGELAEAAGHLESAVNRGDRSPATRFMLDRATLSEPTRFLVSAGRAWSASWSPDGQRVVVADDRAALLWQVAPRRLLATLGHGDTVYAATFSGDELYTAGGDGTVRVWSGSDGAAHRVLRGPAGRRYYALAVGAGQIAAIDLAGDTVDVWSGDGASERVELRASGGGWPAMAFSPDGRWLAATGGVGPAVVYDAGAFSVPSIQLGQRIRAFAWSQRGQLLTGAATGDVSIWDPATGERSAHLREVGAPVDAVAWSQEGAQLAIAERSGAVQVFSAADGQLISQSNELHGKVLDLAFGATGLAAAGTPGVVVTDPVAGILLAELDNPAGAVRSLRWRGPELLGASLDGAARIWSGAPTYRRWTSAGGDDCGIVLSAVPDSAVVAVPCKGRPTRVWDTARGELLAELPDGAALPVVSGQRVAIGHGLIAEIYALPAARTVRAVPHAAQVTAVAIGSDGQLVSGDAAGVVMLSRDGEPLVRLGQLPTAVDAVAALADGRIAIAAGQRLRVIGAEGTLAELDMPAPAGLLRASADRLVVVPSAASAAAPVLYDLDRYQQVAELQGHVGRVFGARWVGKRLLTAGGDGAVRMWNSDGALLVTYRAPGGYLVDAALSPSGQFLLAGGADGKLKMWDTSTGRPVWTMQAHRSAVVGLRWESDSVVSRSFTGEVSRWQIPAVKE